MQIEHVVPKSRGGSNRVSNLVISCAHCNTSKNNKTAGEFGFPDIHSQASSLRDVAAVNTTCKLLLRKLQRLGIPVEVGAGSGTKFNRIRCNLPKTHYYDALCVGSSTPTKICKYDQAVLFIHCKGRGKYKRTIANKYGFPKGYLMCKKTAFGFQSGDWVNISISKGNYAGAYCTKSIAVRERGSFEFKVGTRKISTSYKNCKLVQRFDSYSYEWAQKCCQV